MTDQNSQFFAILTAVGEAKQANADALSIPWTFSEMAVGDANGTDPTPDRLQTSLINEWRRSPLNQLSVDTKNPNIIVAEQIIPAEVGGKWIREVGLFDEAGDLVAIANCPPSYKPLLSQGSGRTQTVRMNLIVSGTANIELKIDPSVVLATRAYVDQRVANEIAKQDAKKSVRAVAAGPITLSGLQVVDGVAIAAGDRVLAPLQTAAKDNGFYTAGTGAWARTADADTSEKVTPGLLVTVEEGAAYGDSIWQLNTNAPIILGTTALLFELMVGKQASQLDAVNGVNATKTMTPLRVAQAIQASAAIVAVDTGTAGAYAGVYKPAITKLEDQMVLRLKAATANPGASTFKVNDLPEAPIVDVTHATLQGGEIVANGELTLQWNSSVRGGSFVLLSSTGGSPLSSPPGIGPSNRIRCIVNAGATEAGWVDDAVIVGSADVKTYRIRDFFATLALNKVGIGGMDKGAAPVNGYILVYAAYNPTTKEYGVFGTLDTAASTGEGGAYATYQGADLPAGYTATALVGVALVGNTATTFGTFTQVGRKLRVIPLTLVSGSSTTTVPRSWQPLTSGSIPYCAISIDGQISATSNYGDGPISILGGIAPIAEGPGMTQLIASSQTGICSANETFVEIPIHTVLRTFTWFFYNSVSASAPVLSAVFLNGFTF